MSAVVCSDPALPEMKNKAPSLTALMAEAEYTAYAHIISIMNTGDLESRLQAISLLVQLKCANS